MVLDHFASLGSQYGIFSILQKVAFTYTTMSICSYGNLVLAHRLTSRKTIIQQQHIVEICQKSFSFCLPSDILPKHFDEFLVSITREK